MRARTGERNVLCATRTCPLCMVNEWGETKVRGCAGYHHQPRHACVVLCERVRAALFQQSDARDVPVLARKVEGSVARRVPRAHVLVQALLLCQLRQQCVQLRRTPLLRMLPQLGDSARGAGWHGRHVPDTSRPQRSYIRMPQDRRLALIRCTQLPRTHRACGDTRTRCTALGGLARESLCGLCSPAPWLRPPRPPGRPAGIARKSLDSSSPVVRPRRVARQQSAESGARAHARGRRPR